MLTAVYLVAIVAEAMSGALAAGRRNMDIFGVAVIAFVTALGGGTIRDLILGRFPVGWTQHPEYIYLVISAGLLLTAVGLTSNIAETSGMSAGLIYRYFQSKNEIILAIIDRQLQDIRADIAQLGTSTDPVEDTVELFAYWRDGNASATQQCLIEGLAIRAVREPDLDLATLRTMLEGLLPGLQAG